MHKVKLNPTVKTLLLLGVGRAGTYKAEDVLLFIEEALTPDTYQIAAPFLRWCEKTGEKFGRGNIDKQYAKYVAWRDRREHE